MKKLKQSDENADEILEDLEGYMEKRRLAEMADEKRLNILEVEQADVRECGDGDGDGDGD